MFFEKDLSGKSAFMKLLESVPFDIIISFSLLLSDLRDNVPESAAPIEDYQEQPLDNE